MFSVPSRENPNLGLIPFLGRSVFLCGKIRPQDEPGHAAKDEPVGSLPHKLFCIVKNVEQKKRGKTAESKHDRESLDAPVEKGLRPDVRVTHERLSYGAEVFAELFVCAFGRHQSEQRRKRVRLPVREGRVGEEARRDPDDGFGAVATGIGHGGAVSGKGLRKSGRHGGKNLLDF